MALNGLFIKGHRFLFGLYLCVGSIQRSSAPLRSACSCPCALSGGGLQARLCQRQATPLVSLVTSQSVAIGRVWPVSQSPRTTLMMPKVFLGRALHCHRSVAVVAAYLIRPLVGYSRCPAGGGLFLVGGDFGTMSFSLGLRSHSLVSKEKVPGLARVLSATCPCV